MEDHSLEPNRAAHLLAAALVLLAMFGLAWFSSRGGFGFVGDSATFDETAHVAAAYTYDHDLDARLNPEHPPLAKALAGIPLVVAGVEGPERDASWGAIDQWKAGRYMLFRSRNDAQKVLFLARVPIMLLMVALGALIYAWASRLYGREVGLLVLVTYAFYPDVLAHGRLVTTDLAAAFGYVVTIYGFDRALRDVCTKNTLLAGIGFGIALLCKMSVLVLVPVLLLLVFVRAAIYRNEERETSAPLRTHLKVYVWVCAVAFAVVWMVYTLFVWRTPPEVEHRLIEKFLTLDPRTLQLRNFLHLFEGSRLTRGLGHYLLGIVCAGGRLWFGNITYIWGTFAIRTIHWYFPVAWLLKTPITVIVLFAASVAYVAVRFPATARDRWTLALLATPTAVYWAIAIGSSLTIGTRHLLPTVPFVLLWVGYGCARLFSAPRRFRALKVAVWALVGFQVVSTVSNFPSFIAYFNEATPRNVRYTRLVDSSLDWGQDLLRLKEYVRAHHIRNVKLDYFGTAEPAYYIPDSERWDSEYGPTTGWLAISAFDYQASKLRGEWYGKWSYQWLDGTAPTAIVGGSILVFHVTPEDLLRRPPVSPYAVTHPVAPGEGRENALFWDLVEYFMKHAR